MIRRTVFLLGALFSLAAGLRAQTLPEPMSPPRLVNDFAGLLTAEQQHRLERKLVDFDRETSTQITVVTVADLEGYAPGDYAQRLHDKWGVGGDGKNNGIVVLVKPRTADSKGEAYISVGYGLEGVVPDITAGRIIDNEMLPAFRQGDMYGGIDRAATVLMQLTRGEFTADEYDGGDSPGGIVAAVILFTLIWIVLAIVSARNRKNGGGGSSSGGRGGGWIPPVILGGGGGRRGGGFSGGGFGGFGGGMSGGGGAGRSW